MKSRLSSPVMLSGAFLLSLCAAASAQTAPSLVPNSGFFGGIGGSVVNANYGTQDVYAVGTSDVYRNGVLVQSGEAAGPAKVKTGSAFAIAPEAQIGYFQKFGSGDWLWGAKLGYGFLNNSADKQNVLLPQAGSYTPTGTTTVVPFTGNAYVRTYETELTHQFWFAPFIGKSFERSFIYIGAGPTLTRAKTTMTDLIGFARVNGTPSDISGQPVNFQGDAWVWGGAVMIGATYFFDKSWFVDVNYKIGVTAQHTDNYYAPFTNPNGTGGTNIVGTLVGSSSGNATTQAISVTLNRAF